MAFIESPRFPDLVSFGALGGPGYQTDVVEVNSGAESRNQRWSMGRCQYEVSHAARLPTAYNALIAFFRNAKGRANAFRFKDWSDFSATASEGRFTSLSSTTFQMVKRYTSGSASEDRIITKPVSGTVTVTGGTLLSVNYTTGIVTMTSGTPTSWSGEFDVPCRFDIDVMKGEIIDKSKRSGRNKFIMGWQSIPIIEVRDIT